MLVGFLTSIMLAAFAGQEPDRNLDIERAAERYAVGGRTFRAFERNLEQAERHGRVSFLNYYFVPGTVVVGDGTTCRHEMEYVELDIRFSLPSWTQYPAAGERDRARYEAFDQAQIDYLTELDALLVEAGGEFLADLRALPDFDCESETGADAFDRLANAWTDAAEAVYDAYRLGETAPEASDQVCAVIGDLIARCAPPAETAPSGLD
jgi:hypothetical protein